MGTNSPCRTTTFRDDQNNYTIVINNNGGIPCTQQPFQECWTCWARPCRRCLEHFFAKETWGPGSCMECSQNETQHDAARYATQAPPAADMGAATAFNARAWNADVDNNSDATDEEVESNYNGNLDSPVTNQGDSAYSRSEFGSPVHKTPAHYQTFMDALFAQDFTPILSQSGMGGLGAVGEDLGEEILDYEPMETEDNENRASTPINPEGPMGAELPPTSPIKGEREKPEKNLTTNEPRGNEENIGPNAGTSSRDKGKGQDKTGIPEEKGETTNDWATRTNRVAHQDTGNSGKYRIPKMGATRGRSSTGKYTTWQLATFDARQEARNKWLAEKEAKLSEEETKKKSEANIRQLKSEIAELRLGDSRSQRKGNRSREQSRSDHGSSRRKQRRN